MSQQGVKPEQIPEKTMHYQLVRAFSNSITGGNPAAVMLFCQWPDTALLQDYARRTAQPVTSMLCKTAQGYAIRWFSAQSEINLCGHGSLAAAAVVFAAEPALQQLNFYSDFGVVAVRRSGSHLCLKLPAFAPEPQPLAVLPLAISQGAIAAAQSRDLILEFLTVTEVQAYQPDFVLIASLPWHALILTAADNSGYVLRYFAPGIGINEDPATGSAHCSLLPYWRSRLGAGPLPARQLSEAGGTFVLQLQADGNQAVVEITTEALLCGTKEL